MFCTDFEKAFDNSETFEMLDSTKIFQSDLFVMLLQQFQIFHWISKGYLFKKEIAVTVITQPTWYKFYKDNPIVFLKISKHLSHVKNADSKEMN